MEARNRYDAVSEAIFLAQKRNQAQRLAPTGTGLPGSPNTGDVIIGGAPQQHLPEKMRLLSGGDGAKEEEAETAAEVAKAGSTVGYRPRTSPDRQGDVRGTATVYPTGSPAPAAADAATKGLYMYRKVDGIDTNF